MAQNMEIMFYEDEEGEKINIKHGELLWGSFRNFAGVKTAFTQDGDRFFNIRVPHERLQEFAEHGLNVKFWRASQDEADEQDELDGFVKVKINYGFWRKPVVVVREGAAGQWVELQEEALGQLDKTEFDEVGLVLKIARGQTAGGRPYATLYLRNAWFTKHKNEPNAYMADMYSEYGWNGATVSSVDDVEEAPFI